MVKLAAIARPCYVSLVMCELKSICPQQRTLVIKAVSAFFSDAEFIQQILNIREEKRTKLFVPLCLFAASLSHGEGAMCKQ